MGYDAFDEEFPMSSTITFFFFSIAWVMLVFLIEVETELLEALLLCLWFFFILF